MVAIEKYHGTGNDFVVVDAGEDILDRRAFATGLCDRESGLSHPDSPRTGADGVLFLDLHADDTPPRVEMTLIQPDGSTAAMCGNGARCAADWAAGRAENRAAQRAENRAAGRAENRAAQRAENRAAGRTASETGETVEEVVVDTPAGLRRADVGEEITVEMGAPAFDPEAVPVESDEPLIEAEVEGLTVTAVNTGVPHAVAVVEDVASVDLAAVAPPVRHADVFPEGANVTLASRRADGGFDQRTYERGVEGETDACGTGAVAIAAVARRLGLVDSGEEVAAHPPGGRLVVSVTDDGSTLRGPVSREFADEIPASPEAGTRGD
jgi:diaminopimelate epimerase